MAPPHEKQPPAGRSGGAAGIVLRRLTDRSTDMVLLLGGLFLGRLRVGSSSLFSSGASPPACARRECINEASAVFSTCGAAFSSAGEGFPVPCTVPTHSSYSTPSSPTGLVEPRKGELVGVFSRYGFPTMPLEGSAHGSSLLSRSPEPVGHRPEHWENLFVTLLPLPPILRAFVDLSRT